MIRFLLGLPFSYRQRKLARSRAPMSKDAFVADIVASGGDGEAAGMVWDAILAFGIVDGVTPYPDDSLGHVFGIAEEERDEDLVLRILMHFRLPRPDSEFIGGFGDIDSARRVAQFVRQCRSR